MDRLCFATYAEMLQMALQEPNDNQSVANLLLEPIINAGNVTDKYREVLQITPKMVSGLFNRKQEIHKGIKGATSSIKVIDAIRHTCEHDVIPFLNPHAKDDYLEKLDNLIFKDSSISTIKRKELMDKSVPPAYRLANILLYSINSSNKLTTKKALPNIQQAEQLTSSEETENSNLYLLMETNGMCPLCGTSLVNDKNGHSVQQYEIVSIYPSLTVSKDEEVWEGVAKPCEELSSNLNKIVLCPKCSKDYKSYTTVAEYQQLLHKKQSLLRNYNAWKKISSIELEDQIEIILRKITTVSHNELSEPLNYNALRIRSKIEIQNFPLIIKTEGFVVNYYNYIKELFTQLESEGHLSFDDISMEVKMCCRKLLKQNLTQDEIFTQLVDWFKIKSSPSYDTACEVIVAFFVQNCEVFDEITK